MALAHLQFEAALARPDMPPCGGRTFNVTDPGPPVAYADMYAAATELSATPVSVTVTAPLPLLVLAHLTEAWCLLLARFPFLTSWFGCREPSGPVHLLQPSVFSVSIHTVVDDSRARRSVAEGGIGYESGCATLEGICEEILEWNREHQGSKAVSGHGPDGGVAKAALVAKGVAA